MESENNFKIDTALSVDVALKKLEKQVYDIIITDYEMPQKNGLDLLREIKKRHDAPPVVIFTGRSREEVVRTALNLGAEGYYTKQGSPEVVYQEIAHGIKTLVEKRKALQALEESEKRYCTILNQAAEIVLVHDIKGKIVDANQQASKSLGYSIEELRSMSIKDVDVGAEFNKQIDQLFSKAIAGEVLTIESTMKRKDNTQIPIEATIGVITLNKEKLLIGMVRDITERKKAEEEIKKQQTLLLGINKIFGEAIRAIDEEELGQVILNLAEEITQSEVGFLAELKSDVLSDIALSVKNLDRCRVVDSKGHRISSGLHGVHGIYGRVLTSGSIVFTNDLDTHPDRIGFPKGHLPLTSFLGVPLKEGQTTIGMIGVGNRKGGYTQNEANLLELIAPAIVEALKHKRAEAALKDSEEKYREMLNEMTDTSWVTGSSGKFIYVNDAATRILGYSRDELLCMGPSDIDNNIGKEQLTAQTKQLFTNKNVVFETVHTAKDGKKIPVEISSNLIMYQGEKAVLSIARDITKRKEMEDLLKSQKMMLTDLYENAPAIYYSIDINQCFTSVNNTMCKLLGYTKEELIGKKVTSIMTEQSINELTAQYPIYLKTGFINNVERQFIRKDGTVIDVVGDVSVQNLDDQTLSIKAVYRDITKQKQIETMLKESEEKHRKILEMAQEGILVFDKDSLIRYANPKLAELLGYSTVDLIEMTIYHLVNPNNIERFNQILAQIENGVKKPFEYELMRKDGAIIYAQILASPVRDETDSFVGMTMLIMDITERREMQKRLQKLAYQLNGLSAGSSYLCDSHERVFKAYSEITFHGVPGLCIAREDPAKLISDYGIKPEEIHLLSQKPLKNFDTVPDLQAVSLAISTFLTTHHSGVVILDGLEYLLSAFGFDSVYRFIQEKRFDFLENDALLLIPIIMATLSEREKALLTSELKLLT